MKIVAITVSAVLVLLAEPPDALALEFSSKTYAVGTAPVAIAIGDFNGDGKPDLAVANSGSNNVSILLNNGDGTFQAAVNYAAGTSPSAILTGDFNGDGKQDLIIANLGDVDNHVNGNLSLLQGNGDGTFQSAVSITAGANPQSIVAGDFNGDKRLDLAVGDARTGILNILLGNGDGTFQSPNSIPLTTFGTVELTAADLNTDSILDLVASIPDGAVALLGKGDGTFQVPVHIADTPNSGSFVAAGSVVAADFDGDHKIDIVFQTLHLAPQACRPVCIDQYQLVFYRGNGDGKLQTGVPVSSFFVVAAGNIVAADFNGDGKVDVALGFFD